MKNKIYDVVVIGGGASGLCTAVYIKQENTGLNVAVTEQLSRVGKKLIVTGNGRCNITNSNINLSRYHGENVGFISYALENYGVKQTEEFFGKIGVALTYDETGRAYPYSFQASSVVDALRFAADELKIDILTDTAVSSLEKTENGYNVGFDGGSINAKCVIAASGLYSGGQKLGSNGSMLNIMKKRGYKTVRTSPAIVKVHTENTVTKALDGIKVNAVATLYCGQEKLRSEFGEVLFCDYGLSGPPVLQISREAQKNPENMKICLDIMPDFDFQELKNMLVCRRNNLKCRSASEFLTGLLNKRVGQTVIKLSGIDRNTQSSNITDNQIKTMVSVIKKTEYKVTKISSYDESQVTAGGLDTTLFDGKTMMSKKEKGLFAVGEILDVDGDCGGFNLQWAWSSAMCAADAVIKYLGGEL